jgi:hypothetical protein
VATGGHLALDVIPDCDPVMREIARVLARDGEVATIVVECAAFAGAWTTARR